MNVCMRILRERASRDMYLDKDICMFIISIYIYTSIHISSHIRIRTLFGLQSPPRPNCNESRPACVTLGPSLAPETVDFSPQRPTQRVYD